MTPPILRPSSLPALAKCPRYSPDQSTGEDQKSDGTKRHTALSRLLADDPGWRGDLGEWDAGGVEWAAEYIRTHAPMSEHPLEIEVRGVAILPDFTEIHGTPDIYCGAHLFDLKGRDIDSYREQMDAYVLQRQHQVVTVHVLYSTERRAETFLVFREDAEARCVEIAQQVSDPGSKPRLCDFCAWCVNRPVCDAFNGAARSGAEVIGIEIPEGNIADVRDADGLAALRTAADAFDEWAKAAKAHVNEMALRNGVIPTGWKIQTRRGAPTIRNAWHAIAASGLPVESVAPHLGIKFGALASVYAEHHGLKEKVAKVDLETRLGPLVERGESISFLTPCS